MRLKTWIVAALGLGSLVLLIAFSMLASSRKAQDIYAQLDDLNNHHRRVEESLRRLRSDVNLSGIFVRDYLLDVARERAPEYREQIAAFRRTNMATISELKTLIRRDDQVESLQAKLDEVTKEARKWETRSKENHQAKTELEKQRQAAMTDAERAIEEARTAARQEATTTFGKRLATSEIRAAAADAGADLAGVFDFLDLGRFVTEDGEPDDKAIKSFVAGLPKKDPGTPSFDGGPRNSPPAQQGMSGLIRKAAGRA